MPEKKTMDAVWLEDGRLQLRQDIPVPEPGQDEALVAVTQAGICQTDLELIKGYSAFHGIPGHEFVGTVSAGPANLLGKRVVGEINACCGRCPTCRARAGCVRHCPERTVLGIAGRHGAMAEYLVLPSANLHEVADNLADDEAIFVEPLAAALEIQEQVHLRPDQRVLVVGDGKLGLLVAQSCSRTGAWVEVAGHHPERIGWFPGTAMRACADAGPDARSYDVAVECTGDAAGFDVALRALRPGGTLIMKSTYTGRLTLDAAAVVVDEITLVGSRCGPFRPALTLLASGQIQTGPLISARFSLDQAEAAFARAAQRGVLKVILGMKAE